MLIKSLNLKENKIRSHFISYHIYWTTIGALFRYLYFPLSRLAVELSAGCFDRSHFWALKMTKAQLELGVSVLVIAG